MNLQLFNYWRFVTNLQKMGDTFQNCKGSWNNVHAPFVDLLSSMKASTVGMSSYFQIPTLMRLIVAMHVANSRGGYGHEFVVSPAPARHLALHMQICTWQSSFRRRWWRPSLSRSSGAQYKKRFERPARYRHPRHLTSPHPSGIISPIRRSYGDELCRLAFLPGQVPYECCCSSACLGFSSMPPLSPHYRELWVPLILLHC